MINNVKKDLYSTVNTIRSNYIENMQSGFIDSVRLCKSDSNINLCFHNFRTRGICGTALIGEKVNTIVLNNKRTKVEQNFDCGHEIMHCNLHKDYEIKLFNCFETVLPKQNRFIEWQANEGAAQLLMPYTDFIEFVLSEKDKFKHNFKQLQQIMAHYYFVPEVSVFFRFEGLKYEIQQALDGVAIDKIELLSANAQTSRGINIKSLNEMFSK